MTEARAPFVAQMITSTVMRQIDASPIDVAAAVTIVDGGLHRRSQTAAERKKPQLLGMHMLALSPVAIVQHQKMVVLHLGERLFKDTDFAHLVEASACLIKSLPQLMIAWPT